MPTALKPDSEEDKLNPAHKDYSEKFLNDFENRAVLSEDELASRRATHTKKSNSNDASSTASSRESDEIPYTPPVTTSNTPRISGGRKKKAGIFGLMGVGGIAGFFFLNILLLPMKIPAVLQSIVDNAGQRVEQVTERRAKVILARIILGQTATGGDKFIILGKGPVASLAATLRTNNFEKKLEQNHGLKIVKHPDGGVRLIHKGTQLDGGKALKNTDAIVKALDSTNLSRKMLRDVIKEEIPTWRWMKRAKIKKWISLRYHIPRFGITNSEKESEEERIKEMQEQRLQQGYDRVGDSVEAAIDCYAGQDCPEQIDGTADNVKDPESEDGKAHVDEAGGGLTGDAAEAASKKPLAAIVLEKLNEKITKIILSKSYSAIPVIGQIVGLIDTAALFHHIAHAAIDNDYFSQVPAYFRAMSYAQMYADWQGYADQLKAGELDPAFVGVLATQLNGLEQSRAHSYLQGDATKGIEIKHKINSNKKSKYIDEFRTILNLYDSNSFSPFGISLHLSLPGLPDLNIDFGLSNHDLLNYWYDWIGQTLEWIVDKILGLIGLIIPDEWLSTVMEAIVSSLGSWAKGLLEKAMEFMLPLLGVVVDPLDTGADLHNDLHAGASTAYNSYCKEELGCRKLTTAQASLQQQIIAQDKSEYAQSKGLAYQVFNAENTDSFVNQLAIRTTHDNNPITSTVAAIGNLLGMMPQRLFALAAPTSDAAVGYVDLYGEDPYGGTERDLNQPVAPEAMSGEDCPAVAKDSYNNCNIDKKVAESMKCNFTPGESECGASSSSSTEGGAAFRIATFNILGESHDNDSPGRTPWNIRIEKTIKVMEDHNLEVVGLQEFQKIQWEEFMKRKGDTYDIYPEKPDYNGGRGAGQGPPSVNSIIWNKNTFSLVEGGIMPGLVYFNGKKLHAPWVILEYMETGQQFYVLNTHDPAGPEYAKQRYENATQHAKFVKEISQKGLPIFFTGDFNSGYENRYGNKNTTYEGKSENLTYCIINREGGLRDAYDVAEGRAFKCPNPGNDNSVDHIFISPEVQVPKYHKVKAGESSNGSDVHDTHIADVVIPGTGSGGGTDFVISTYNIKKAMGSRLDKIANNIRSNNMDVVGFQEVSNPDVHQAIVNKFGSDYGVYPTQAVADLTKVVPEYSKTIIYNKNKFNFIKADSSLKVPVYSHTGKGAVCNNPRDGCDPTTIPIIWLQDKETGQTIIVMNTHNAAFATFARDRYQAAVAYTEKIKQLQGEGLPIFFTGDFNEGYGVRHPPRSATLDRDYRNLFYCMMVDNKLLVSAEDKANKSDPYCNATRGIGGVDYIYVSPVVEVEWYRRIDGGDINTSPAASDHDAHYAHVVVPGTGSADSTKGWVWPMKPPVHAGPCFGSPTSRGAHAGMDINTVSSNNPALAAHSGTVYTVGSGDRYAGNYVIIKTTDGKYYYSYQHLKSVSVSKGDTVNAGDKVGIAGLTGTVFVSAAKGHLHMVVATRPTLGSAGHLDGLIDPMKVLPKDAPGGYKCSP